MDRNKGSIVIGFVIAAALACGAHAAPATETMPMTHEIHRNTADGNTVCPVNGEPVAKDSNVTYTYKGTVYRFCCPMCIEEFKKDPEKYIKQMKQKEKEGEKEKAR
jgi:YHS domain-containing protein